MAPINSTAQTEAGSGGAGGLGVNTAGGSYRNLSQYLAANQQYAQGQARNVAQGLQDEANKSIQNIPTWAAYSASQYPVSATIDAGTQPTGSTPTSGSRPPPPAGTTYPSGTARPAPPRPGSAPGGTTAPPPRTGAGGTPTTGTRPPAAQPGTRPAPAPRGGGTQPTASLSPDQATYQAQGGELGYKIGTGGTFPGMRSMLRGSEGAKNLDAYLMTGDPRAQQYNRDLQQNFGGLLGLVASGVPYGSTMNAEGQAINHPDNKPPPAPAPYSGSTGTPRPPPPAPPTGTRPPANEEGPQYGDQNDRGYYWNGSRWVSPAMWQRIEGLDENRRNPSGGQYYTP